MIVNHFDVIVIGGGAAGLMAAGKAANTGQKVLLIEKNRKLGEKLSITGGGRCNITNAESDLKELLSHYGEAEQFLYSAFTEFGVNDTFQFFEGKGLPLKVEARKRAFPKSEKAADVVKVLTNYCKEGKWTAVAVFAPRISIDAVGSLWTEMEQSIGECMLFAGEKLQHQLVEAEDQMYSLEVLASLEEIIKAKGTPHSVDFREQGVKLREVRETLLRIMRQELGATLSS